jgi:hypothetical protein
MTTTDRLTNLYPAILALAKRRPEPEDAAHYAVQRLLERERRQPGFMAARDDAGIRAFCWFKIMDYYRRNTTYTKYVDCLTFAHLIPDRAPTPEAVYIQKQLRHAVRAALYA